MAGIAPNNEIVHITTDTTINPHPVNFGLRFLFNNTTAHTPNTMPIIPGKITGVALIKSDDS